MHKMTALICTLIFSAAVNADGKEAMAGHAPASASAAQQSYQAGMDKMHHQMMTSMQESDPDRAFAKGMTAHHQGAIDMAKTELKYGKDPEMRALAAEIIKAQQPEIDRMQNWLKHQPK
ncbi:DUF305 domain-containing protein [Pantoea sp. CCBC3-3-1]|uniref:CopM family metallochaperone n=1 Tax=Pantoea sp. CCBC3-3-1 TaxID=2490851 RepID=UPI0011BF94AA